jgi:ABC-type multidrug transport system ATPase subunit
MKICPQCQGENPSSGRFCQQCGQPFPAGDSTQHLSPGSVAGMASGPRRQSFDLATLFAKGERLIIGRASDCDIALDHPSVSRYHARLERRAGATVLSDLSSVNGVWVAGQRIREATPLAEGETVGIGPYLLTLQGGRLQTVDNSRGLRLEARGLTVEVPLATGRLRILDDINLCIHPGEFVAILGPSGCGKSTLMDALNGRRRATAGRVLANGEDFYRHFDSFRQSLGYVPQRDIVHTQLTVRRALTYTAQLRLPLDTAPAELQARVEDVLRRMELLPHQDKLVAELSGGQIKRVSLGAELLASPSLLYIDEATSGLDAGTEKRMMHLFRELADDGRSLVCITHNVDHVDQCHLVMILSRGKLVFCGPPHEAPRWFGVKRISEIYDRLGEHDPAEWERRFRASDLHRTFVADRLAVPMAPGSTAPSEMPPPPIIPPSIKDLSEKVFPPLADRFRQLEDRMLRVRERLRPLTEGGYQFSVLLARYLELTFGDARSRRLLLLQAPLVAVFLLLGFWGKPFTKPMPILRPLDDSERRTLLVLRGVGELLDDRQPLTAEQKEALRRVELRLAGVDVQFNGARLVELLRLLQSERLTPAQRRALEETSLTLQVDGQEMPIRASEAIAVWRNFQNSEIPKKLLTIDGPVVPTRDWYDPRFTYTLLFVLAVVVFWFGCNNAAREIVKEEAIYARERAVNLRLMPYLASKFVVLGAITAVQVATLLLLVYGPMELARLYLPGYSVPPPELMLSYVPQFGVLVALGLVGVAMGLLLSASVTSAERANALLPYVVIPQMILGGGFIEITGPLYWTAALGAPVYWAYRALHLGATQLPVGFPGHRIEADGILLPLLALTLQGTVLAIATVVMMRRKG